jgi:hypothetical protein
MFPIRSTGDNVFGQGTSEQNLNNQRKNSDAYHCQIGASIPSNGGGCPWR